MSELVAFYRGYRSTRVGRLHIMQAGASHALCNIHAYNATKSPRMDVRPFPTTPPDGLTWCPKCVGYALERCGLTDDAVILLAQQFYNAKLERQ